MINTLKNALMDYLKNFFIVIPSIAFFAVVALLSYVSNRINISYIQQSQSNFLLYGWLIIFTLVILLISSYFLSGLIGLAVLAIRNKLLIKSSAKEFFNYANRFVFRNFVILFIIQLGWMIISIVSIYGARAIGLSLDLSVDSAKIILFLIMFAGLAGILIFLSLAGFYAVIDNSGIISSLRKSIYGVKKNYPVILLIGVAYFIAEKILDLIKISIIATAIEAVVIVPLLIIILTRIAIKTK